MAEVVYPAVGYGLAVALDEGTGTYNYAVLRESGAGQPVVLAAEGLDDNISISFAPKGTGTVDFGAFSFATLSVAGLSSLGTASTNYLTIAGAATTLPPTIQAVGADTDIDVRVLGKGTGVLSSLRIYNGGTGARSSMNANGRFYSRIDGAFTGAGWATAEWRGNLSGSLTSSLTGVFNIFADSDTVAAGGSRGLDLVKIVDAVQTGATGGRNALVVNLLTQGDVTVDNDVYHLAGAFASVASGSLGGFHNNPRGDVFGLNPIAGVKTGAGSAVNAVIGLESNCYANTDTEATWQMGIQIVHGGAGNVHNSRGWITDTALGFADAISTTAPWRTLIAVGMPNGRWPLAADSQMMTTLSTGLTSGTYEVADLFDFSRVTVHRNAFMTANMAIDGNGNIGGLTTSGAALQTRSAVVAKTAVVATVDVIDGGLFAGGSAPTLEFSAPPGSGSTATADMSTFAAGRVIDIPAGGTGYVVGDILTAVGGTGTAATLRVVKLGANGSVRGLKVQTGGNYSVRPGSGVSTTGGTGTGCTVTMRYAVLTITVTSGGSNYPEFPAPTIRFAGGTVSRKLVARVNMTATQTGLSLNPGGRVIVDTHTPSSASDTGTAGTVAWDSNYIYVCTAANTWKRAAIATW